jgi:F-type H+-transporting ATPase subunit a
MPLDMSITKNVFVIMLMAGFMLFVFGRIAKSYKTSALPSGSGKFLEPIIIFVRDEIAIPNIGEKHYKKYMSYLLTVFFFIWFINLFGMFPLGINVTGNIAITFALAILTFIITQFTGKSSYWAHIFWMPGVPVPMKILLMPIELIGVFIKPFALMIRLYANMKAGHVVLMSLIAVMYTFQNWGAKGAFLGLTLVLSLLELLVAALQAYIFTMLTALYFGAASEEHGDH